MTIGFDCLPIVSADRQEGIQRGNWNIAFAKRRKGYAGKTIGSPVGDRMLSPNDGCGFACKQILLYLEYMVKNQSKSRTSIPKIF